MNFVINSRVILLISVASFDVAREIFLIWELNSLNDFSSEEVSYSVVHIT
jgi:hypothetical protein